VGSTGCREGPVEDLDAVGNPAFATAVSFSLRVPDRETWRSTDAFLDRSDGMRRAHALPTQWPKRPVARMSYAIQEPRTTEKRPIHIRICSDIRTISKGHRVLLATAFGASRRMRMSGVALPPQCFAHAPGDVRTG